MEKTIKDLQVGDVCYRIYDGTGIYCRKVICESIKPYGKIIGGFCDKYEIVFSLNDVKLNYICESYRSLIIDNVGFICLDKESAIKHLLWKKEDIDNIIKELEEEN